MRNRKPGNQRRGEIQPKERECRADDQGIIIRQLAYSPAGMSRASFALPLTPLHWRQIMTPLASATTEQAELKSFTTPDEVREVPKGRLELMKIGGATIGRAVFEPGWRWATSVQPIAKTSSCEAPHFQYTATGVPRIRTG